MVINKIYDYGVELGDSHLSCLRLIDKGGKVLEFGPGTGFMTRALRDKLDCAVTCFEYSPEAAAKASEFSEKMVVGDIEDADLWQQLSPPYDTVVFADVLEHLRDPKEVLIHSREILDPNGQLIISVPNIAHWTIRESLLFGHFDYTDTGLLDNTHTHFFTRKSLIEMVKEAGFNVEKISYTKNTYPFDKIFSKRVIRRFTKLKSVANNYIECVVPDAIAFQYILLARPKL